MESKVDIGLGLCVSILLVLVSIGPSVVFSSCGVVDPVISVDDAAVTADFPADGVVAVKFPS